MNVKQMAIMTGVVVALVVIVTLMKIGVGGPAGGGGTVPTVDLGTPLLGFTTTQGPHGQLDPRLPPEQEAKADGHFDFWFTNDKDVPVDVFVARVSCNRCLKVGLGLAPEGWDSAQPPAADVAWTILETEEVRDHAKGFTVPPKRGGWVRLNWSDEEVGPKLLSTDLRTPSKLPPAPGIHLEYGAVFVDPVRVQPDSKELGIATLSSNDDKPHTVVFLVYSSTRDSFPLAAEPDEVQKSRHPFVVCGEPVALTAEECRDKEKEFKHAFRCGYKVPVTMTERLKDGREHDLGAFRTGVTLKSEGVLGEDLGLYVHGIVRGPGVKVVASEDVEDRIPIGNFRRDIECVRTVHLETNAGTKLAIEKKPDFMEAELTDESDGQGKTWALTVTIPANAVNGRFPNYDDPNLSDTAIYLKANDRKLRIPVSGTASQK